MRHIASKLVLDALEQMRLTKQGYLGHREAKKAICPMWFA